MFKQTTPSSLVTLILPPPVMRQITAESFLDDFGTALLHRARGSLLQEHWLKKWLPPVSPAKSMLQLMVQPGEVDSLVSRIVKQSNLDQQAVGAVFSSDSDEVHFGPDYRRQVTDKDATANQKLMREKLHAIYCIVSHKQSDRVCKAAIDAGAHGPIVHYSEGRGLRDRLGWLRITKEHEKEVLIVLCDEDALDGVFMAMAAAGELHLPGRGFMYQIDVEHGMFNLPSRAAHKHHDASMQQIIAAIDNLQGHSHWRDASTLQIGHQGKAIGLGGTSKVSVKEDQYRLFAMVAWDQLHPFIDLLLDNGAPGLNFTQALDVNGSSAEITDESNLASEYAVIRSIADAESTRRLAEAIEQNAAAKGVTDFCASVNPVAQVATYIPGRVDYRKTA